MKKAFLTTYFVVMSILAFAQTATSSYSFTGNANDNIGNNDGTVYGAVLTEDRFGNPNAAYQFDGIDDYIDFGDSSEFRFNGSYTLSTWVYIEDTLGQNIGTILVKRNPNSPYNQYNLSVTSDIQFGGNGNTIKFLHKGDIMPVSRILSSPNLTVGWHHLAVVHNAVDQVLKMYFDNVLISTTSYSNSNEQVLEVSGRPFEIGGNIVSNNHFKGKIDDVSIYRDTLSATAISDLYYQIDTTSCLVAQYTFDNNSAEDQKGNRDAVLDGATFGNDRYGNSNNALKIAGVGSDQATYIPHPIINPNNDFSISYWVNVDSFNTSQNFQYFVTSRHTATGAEQGGVDMGVNGSGEFVCVLRTSSTSIATVNSSAQTTSEWHHVVAVRANDTLKLYVDNVLVGTDAISNTNMNFPSFWTLGSIYNPGPIIYRELSGRLDDVRFYCRGLSAAEITTLYPLSTSHTIPKTSIACKIYPNPVQDVVNIELEERWNGQVQIINVSGQILYQEDINETSHSIDGRNLQTGIYFVRLLNKEGQVITRKFVK
ncbi:LamG-like jellyroll fold domain-containing protein [Aureispira sp. CCB-E]|uniref:LamG-like jellyroll fold domain-containing protein n=1 Tax=Aureispira sp. CCB-E TaxID=3051121 RepID=UPI00286918CB|nr:LamG-like jellyroll fold domain-containing protein [Aureispira sp. CCB-E]WMX12736.1 LamG-like jellyroll fold domain-containing protein [Aureispira sp. CCB-E]